MKIAVYSAKGGVGKSPISQNIIFDRGYAVGTNELSHLYGDMLPENRVLEIEEGDEFPELPDETNIVFDLGGSLSRGSAPSVLSAVRQADLVIVPCFNDPDAINKSALTLLEVREVNPNILVVATKLEKRGKESFTDWSQSYEFQFITGQLDARTDHKWPAVPLKKTRVFEAVQEQRKSIAQICDGFGLDRYLHRAINDQFNAIYQFIDGGAYA
ncbi:MAG: hypothetical protein AAGB04_21580 [Pseudomonadota bacterium]